MRDEILVNLSFLPCSDASDPANPVENTLVENGAIVLKGSEIAWCGPAAELPAEFSAMQTRDLEGRLVTPSLIDCHTHIVHGGHRAAEFEQRLTGVSYEEIAASGGGIVSTMTATRKASVDQLVESALPRVDSLMAEGVATMEIKSGYGLDEETELNMLRAARQIARVRHINIKTSFLGAHAVPGEYKGRPDEYIDSVCIPALEKAHGEGLVDTVDGFCESIAFNTAQIQRVFDKAVALGLPVKLHAEQLTLSGGAELAARYKAQSADHLEYLDEAGVRAMADANVVAVLLPGAFYTLHETQAPPVELFRKHKVPMALATDCNPGSSPLSSLLLTMNMGCTLFRLTPQEALSAVTRNAALALGLRQHGEIRPGVPVELAVWNIKQPAELCYRIGFNPLHERISAMTAEPAA